MLKVAVIGCGFFSSNHLHAWSQIEDVEIVGVCDLDQAKAIWAGARSYSDARDMLLVEKPDFVDIITTVDSHRPLVELAASLGVAVICQKPFANTLEDAKAMVDVCARASLPLMVHENFRFQSPIMAIKRLLEEGRIGKPSYARISFRHGYDIYTGQPYLLTEKRLAIMDLGIHLLDVLRYLMAEPSRLFCRTQQVNPRVVGEDCVTITTDHEDGGVALVDFSFAAVIDPDPFPQTLIRIEGDRGTLELLEGYKLRVSGDGPPVEINVEPKVPAFGAKPWHAIQESVCNIQQHWVDCLKQNREPATSGADNLKTLELVLRAYDSAASGRAL